MSTKRWILTAAVLYQYGTGPVKGFAVTLIAGIFASLITSIFVVRTFYQLWLNRSRGAEKMNGKSILILQTIVLKFANQPRVPLKNIPVCQWRGDSGLAHVNKIRRAGI